MIIERIDEKKLMIMLEEQDMTSLELTYDRISWKNQKFKLLIAKLLALAKFKTGFSVDDSKLSIETMPQGAGCVIIFTISSDTKLKKSEPKELVPCYKDDVDMYIYKFNDFEELIEVCTKIDSIENKQIDFSTIFKLKDKYFILFYPKDGVLPKEISMLLSEYGDKVKYSKIFDAYLHEFGEIVHKNNALSYIGKCFK